LRNTNAPLTISLVASTKSSLAATTTDMIHAKHF
jgi:hypothetical protein